MSKFNSYIALSFILVISLVFFGSLTISQAETEDTKPGTVINGLDTAKLNGLIDHLKKNPDKGRVTFYSKARWQDGMRAFTGFRGYKIDGEMVHEKTREFVLLGDEATELSGTDAAPGAVEELMYAISTCVIAAANANAALMGVKLTRLDVDIESDLDMHGLFALDPEVRPGLTNVRMNITIAGDAEEEVLNKIAMLGYQYSPVSETTRNGIKFTPNITVAR
ncbi:MAG: OsmC family protein [Deltaproteobacteria bacterium]